MATRTSARTVSTGDLVTIIDHIRAHRAEWEREWHSRTTESFARELSGAVGTEVSPATVIRVAESLKFPPKKRVKKPAATVHFAVQARMDAIQAVVERIADQLGIDAAELTPFHLPADMR